MFVPVKFEISVVQVGKSFKITIPVEIAKHLGIKKGDTVQLWVDNNHMIVEKLGKLGLEESEREERDKRKALTRREGEPSSIPTRERSYF